MDISNISVSRHDVWKQCTALYRYKYHLKLKSTEPEPFYFKYGRMVHRIAEEFILNRGSLPLQEISSAMVNGTQPIELNEQGVPSFAPKFPAEYMRRLPKHLEAIQRLTDSIGFDGETEYEFNYDLDPPNERFMKGVIDRFIRKNDHFWIIDYKTSKPGRWMKKRVDNDLQLQCYARVIQKTFDVPAKNIRAGLYYVETSKSVGAIFSDKTLIQAEEHMLETYKEIENMPPENAWGNVGDHCARCDYRKQCPFYRIS